MTDNTEREALRVPIACEVNDLILYVLINGETVALADCDWIARGPCGCVCGMTMAVVRGGSIVLTTEAAAWDVLFGGDETDTARRRGFRVDLEAASRRTMGCTHSPRWGVA